MSLDIAYTEPASSQRLLGTIVDRMNRSLTPLGEQGPATGSEGEPTRFTIRLAEGYANEVQADPASFSWEGLAHHVRIRIQPSDIWNQNGGKRRIRMEAVAVRADSLFGKVAGEGFLVTADGTVLNEEGLPVEQTEAGGRVPADPSVLGAGLRELARKVSLGFEEGDRFHAPFPGDAANPRQRHELARAARGRAALVLYLDYVDPASGWAAVTEPLVFMLPGR